MRQAGLSDLHHAALVLGGLDAEQRESACRELMWQAHVADKYVKRLRKIHPQWGDGSLRSAALGIGGPCRAGLPEPRYFAALGLVARTLAERKRR